MRVLITSPAGLGHIHPMVPLARAIAAHDHDVLWACPADGVRAAARSGVRAMATAEALPIGPALFKQRYPELSDVPPAELPELMFGKLWGAIVAPVMLAGMVPVALDWRPDLVVCDAAEFAGHIVARELGVPSVTKGFGPLLPKSRVALVAQEVAPLWRSRGLEPRPYGGSYDTLYLDSYPPPLQLQLQHADHVSRSALLRPDRDDGLLDSASPPPIPEEPAEAPLVYVTMGTIFADSKLLEMVMQALIAHGARALITVGPAGDPSSLDPHPPNVQVTRYVPQSAVLAHCDAVISHGGSGTVLGAVAHGLPQLCLPQGADQFLNAKAVSAAGAGLAIAPGDCTPETVAEAVARLLSDQSIRDAAVRVADSIASMPSVEEGVSVLEGLTRAG